MFSSARRPTKSGKKVARRDLHPGTDTAAAGRCPLTRKSQGVLWAAEMPGKAFLKQSLVLSGNSSACRNKRFTDRLYLGRKMYKDER